MSRPATGLARAGEPGTHSGLVRRLVQNIGAYGVEPASVPTWRRSIGRVARLSASRRDRLRLVTAMAHLRHDYQDSHFIIAVGLRLPKAWRPVAGYGPLAALGMPLRTGHFDTVCATRMAKLPDRRCYGQRERISKNPVVPAALAETLKQQYPQMPRDPAAAEGQAKLAAGWVASIQCGLKGVLPSVIAAVHQEQALVLVNLGAPSAMELIALAHVRDSVEHQFGWCWNMRALHGAQR